MQQTQSANTWPAGLAPNKPSQRHHGCRGMPPLWYVWNVDARFLRPPRKWVLELDVHRWQTTTRSYSTIVQSSRGVATILHWYDHRSFDGALFFFSTKLTTIFEIRGTHRTLLVVRTLLLYWIKHAFCPNKASCFSLKINSIDDWGCMDRLRPATPLQSSANHWITSGNVYDCVEWCVLCSPPIAPPTLLLVGTRNGRK